MTKKLCAEVANGIPSEYEAALDMTRDDLERLLDIQEKNRMINMLNSGFVDPKEAKKLKRAIHRIENHQAPKNEIGLTQDEINALKSAGLWQM